MAKTHAIGKWLAALGYAVLGVNGVLNFLWGQGHAEHMQDSGQYLGLWPTTLAVALAIATLMLLFSAVSSARKGTASLVAILIVGIPRIATDLRCLANIATQHGCHTFMAAMVLIVTGSVLLLIPDRR